MNLSGTQKFKILAVDDEKTNLDVLIHILREQYLVYPAKTGEACLKKAIEIKPDLILLDIIMPDMNGFEVLQKLKADDMTEHIPVIFVSSLNNIEDEKRGLRLGAVDYIMKPYNSEIVKARVRTHLQLIQQSRTIDEIGMIDEVTGMPNRKSFDNQLVIEWGRAVREKNPVSLIMVELDEYALFKESRGRQYAEKLLTGVADVIKNRLKRVTDFKARYREATFAVILPNTPQKGALNVSKDIISGTQKLVLEDDVKIALSIGVSVMEPKSDDPVSYFVLQADRNLFNAKSEESRMSY